MKLEAKPDCATDVHPTLEAGLFIGSSGLERTARLFRALGDPARIRLVARLAAQPGCVTELADAEGESIPVISQRLRVLRADNIVSRRRDGKHLIYFLADQHVLDLVLNGMAHASEQVHSPTTHHIPRYLPYRKE